MGGNRGVRKGIGIELCHLLHLDSKRGENETEREEIGWKTFSHIVQNKPSQQWKDWEGRHILLPSLPLLTPFFPFLSLIVIQNFFEM